MLLGKQKEFIDLVANGEQYILVEAPAGTGKTYCCIHAARRIWNDRKILDFQKVLVLTFSRNARAQILKELMSVPTHEGLHRHIEVSNYHSFFKKYIDSYRNLIGINEPITVLDDASYIEEMLRYAKQKSLTIPRILDCEIHDDYDCCDQEFLCVNQGRKHKKVNCKEIEEFFAVSLAFSRDTGKITFSLFGRLFCMIVNKSIDIARAISHDYPVIMFDEYQDTNYFQEMFVRQVTANSRCIFLADSMQMIYSFRGSTVARISELSVMYPSIKKVELDFYYRYRDRPDLISILKAVRLGQRIDYTVLQNGRVIQCNVACNNNWVVIKGKSHVAQCTIFCKALFRSMIKTVISLLKMNKSVAVLCYKNDVTDRLTEVFFEHNFHPKSINDNKAMLSLTKSIKTAICGDGNISEKARYFFALAAFCTMNMRLDGETINQILELSCTQLSRKRKPVMKEIYNILAPYLNSTSQRDAHIIIGKILDHMKLHDKGIINYMRTRFIQHCISTNDLTPEKVDNIMLQHQYVDSYTKISPGLYISTIHQSKGKEFDSVFVVDVNGLTKDLNLLYVAHSRMKESLYPIRITYTGVVY